MFLADWRRLGLALGIDTIRNAVITLRATGGTAWVAEVARGTVPVVATRALIRLARFDVHADPTGITDYADLVIGAVGAGQSTSDGALTRARCLDTGADAVITPGAARARARVAVLVVRAVAVVVAWCEDLTRHLIDARPAPVSARGNLTDATERSLFGALEGEAVVAVNRSTVDERIEFADEVTTDARTADLDRLAPSTVEDLSGRLARQTVWWNDVGVRFRVRDIGLGQIGFFGVGIRD